VLLEFMEPWCPHCQNMAPVLESLYSQYGKGNVVFISVAGPWDGASASDAAKFVSQYGSSWTYVYDSSGTIFSEYGVNSTPTFFVIGTDGSVAGTFTGEQTADTLGGALSAAGGT
jgi:protein-disulfide isomerase